MATTFAQQRAIDNFYNNLDKETIAFLQDWVEETQEETRDYYNRHFEKFAHCDEGNFDN